MIAVRTTYLWLVFALAWSAVGWAQQSTAPAQSQVQQQSQQGATEQMKRAQRYIVVPKLSPDDQEEFGQQVVLAEKPVQPIFIASTDNQLLFESNALLTHDGQQSDMLFISTTGFNIIPPLPEEYKKFILNFNGRFQAYRYGEQRQLNFHIYTGGVTGGYQFDELTTLLTGHSYNIYYNEQTYDHFFDETDHYVSINRAIPIAEDLAAFTGAQVQYRNTSPALFERMEYDLFGGIRYALDEKWVAQAYQRAEYQQYITNTRQDWNLQTVLSLTYYFNEWVSARIMGHYTYNNSNNNTLDYQNFESGGGITFTAQF